MTDSLNLVLAAVLTVPEMVVTAVGDVLQVSFNKLPHPAVVSVTVWKKGDEQQVRVYFTSLFPSFVLFIQVSNYLLIIPLLPYLLIV